MVNTAHSQEGYEIGRSFCRTRIAVSLNGLSAVVLLEAAKKDWANILATVRA